MPKSDSAQTLLKRLEKIERAQARLGDINTRILAQAATLADLLKVAQAFAGEDTTPTAVGGSRPATRAKKAPSAKPRSGSAPATPRAAAAKPAARRAPASARVRKTSSARTPRRPARPA